MDSAVLSAVSGLVGSVLGAAGVPARVVRTGGPHEPARAVIEILSDRSYERFSWAI